MSSAVTPFDHSQLQELLEKSRRENHARGVTGMLLHKDGSFLQVIEGEQAVVEALYELISLDPRHKGVTTFVRESIPAREFADWSMAYRDLAVEPGHTEGFNELLNATGTKTDLSAYSNRVRSFMKMFVP